MRYSLILFLLFTCQIGKSLQSLIENLNFDLVDEWNEEESCNIKKVHDIFRKADEDVVFTFDHGVASGDPQVDSVILWTRITPQEYRLQSETERKTFMELNLIVSTNPHFEDDINRFTTFTSNEVDYTVKVLVPNLIPNTTYYYMFIGNNGFTSNIGRTKTLPFNDFVGEIKLAVYSCSNYAGGYYHAYKAALQEDDVDYVLHLGDYIYEYANGKYTNGTSLGRTHVPLHECETLEDYRSRYASYRQDNDLKYLHSRVPWIVVWDDHEVSDNSWLRGSVASSGFSFLKRKKAGLRAYLEWLPVKHSSSNSYKIWRRFKFGNLFQLQMLDTRHYSRDVTDDYQNTNYINQIRDREERTLLGFDQEHWLQDNLMQNSSIWNLVASQCIIKDLDLSHDNIRIGGPAYEKLNHDSWDGYTASRRRLLDHIYNEKIANTVILSGDFHVNVASELSANPFNYDIETGNGSMAVEFSVTAVSSPTVFLGGDDREICRNISSSLVESNTGVLWNEGYYRGYYKLKILKERVTCEFYGFNIKSKKDSTPILLANFTVSEGTNKIDRQLSFFKDGYMHSSLLKLSI